MLTIPDNNSFQTFYDSKAAISKFNVFERSTKMDSNRRVRQILRNWRKYGKCDPHSCVVNFYRMSRRQKLLSPSYKSISS